MAAFATAAELQTLIGGTGGNTTRMDALLTHASEVIRRHTGQTLSAVTGDAKTLPHEHPHHWRLFLPELPVTAVTMTVGGVAFTAFTWTASGILTKDSGVWDSDPVVTYSHGYAAGSQELGAIKAVCLEMAARAYTMNKDSSFEEYGGAQSEASGWAPELVVLRHEAKTLDNFVRIPA